MSQRPWLFRQTDISRAFRAARAAGITARVDIAPDGTIRVFQLTDDPQGPPKINEWDGVLGKPPASLRP